MLLPSLGSAQKARISARAFDQKAYLARLVQYFKKIVLWKFWKNELFQKFTKMNDAKSKMCDWKSIHLPPNLLKVSKNHRIWSMRSRKTNKKGQILGSFLKRLKLGSARQKVGSGASLVNKYLPHKPFSKSFFFSDLFLHQNISKSILDIL